MRTNYQNIYNTMVKEEEARKQKALAEAAMADSEYRKNVESLTNYRLNVVQKAEKVFPRSHSFSEPLSPSLSYPFLSFR